MRIAIAALLLCPYAAAEGGKIQPLDVKPGLWETTTTVTTSGQMPIPPELLSRMTPEQRVKIKERLKAQSGKRTRTVTRKKCLTKEDLQKGVMFMADKKGCTQTVMTSNSSQADVQVACENEGLKTQWTVHLQAANSKNVKGSIHAAASGGGDTMNSESTFTSKWTGASCGDIK